MKYRARRACSSERGWGLDYGGEVPVFRACDEYGASATSAFRLRGRHAGDGVEDFSTLWQTAYATWPREPLDAEARDGDLAIMAERGESA